MQTRKENRSFFILFYSIFTTLVRSLILYLYHCSRIPYKNISSPPSKYFQANSTVTQFFAFSSALPHTFILFEPEDKNFEPIESFGLCANIFIRKVSFFFFFFFWSWLWNTNSLIYHTCSINVSPCLWTKRFSLSVVFSVLLSETNVTSLTVSCCFWSFCFLANISIIEYSSGGRECAPTSVGKLGRVPIRTILYYITIFLYSVVVWLLNVCVCACFSPFLYFEIWVSIRNLGETCRKPNPCRLIEIYFWYEK